jgi:hypothetical protein
MRSAPTAQNAAAQVATAPDRSPPVRLRVKPRANTVSGVLDGGWPRPRDLNGRREAAEAEERWELDGGHVRVGV